MAAIPKPVCPLNFTIVIIAFVIVAGCRAGSSGRMSANQMDFGE